jgi:hypothetical protein
MRNTRKLLSRSTPFQAESSRINGWLTGKGYTGELSDKLITYFQTKSGLTTGKTLTDHIITTINSLGYTGSTDDQLNQFFTVKTGKTNRIDAENAFWADSSLDFSTITPPDSYTKVLLHMNGADGSTTFTDSSTSPLTVTANGNAQIDTAFQKFGTGSGLLDGVDDYLSIAQTTSTNLTDTYTIDFWYRPTNASNYQSIFNKYQDDNNRVRIIWRASDVAGGGRFLIQTAIGGVSTSLSTEAGQNWVPTLSASFYHVAIVRNVNDLQVFIDGTQLGATQTFSVSTPTISGTTYIGAENQTGSMEYEMYGNIDEYRVSVGVARWTANFTPPTSEY